MGLHDELLRQNYVSGERRRDFNEFWQARKQVLAGQCETDPLHKALRESQDLSKRLTDNLAFLREQAAACAASMTVIDALTKYAPGDNQRIKAACGKFINDALNTPNTAALTQQLAAIAAAYLDYAQCLDELRQALSDEQLG